ncbi:MAG: hypothetical protein A4E45_00997 [Methanosaeta sp. PtaB.Bin039]|nr:MAG: hypothetical protein A4E45_00997 [Methanosaeta sp. PtaB.Bin039]OPY45025.1 MAG: hypothetical protein A4E47_01209 [Methanosaeta sp. PtaU1.Bin028]
MSIRKRPCASLLILLLILIALIFPSAYSQPCPQGCQCLTEEKAKELFGVGKYQRCLSTPCGEERTATGQTILKYCFKPACPQGCQCLTEEKAKEMGYNLCNGQRISCGLDPNGKPLYCFSAPTTRCPTGCQCLTEEAAKELFGVGKYQRCLSTPCGEERTATGQTVPKYCFKPACPQGCQCLTEEKAKEMGYNLCNGQRTSCGLDPNGKPLYCFQTPEPEMCRYDYNLGKCVGSCSADTRCLLNTIYRDPKTGKVTYAECHCK